MQLLYKKKRHRNQYRNVLFLFAAAMHLSYVHAQSTAGITNKPDTSYSTYSAYISTLKTHPAISIVPELHSPAVKEKRNIVYCSFGNRNLIMDAFYPSKKKKNNGIAILFIHGGGWRTGSRSQHYALAQHLASLGYTCFTPEYRLSTEALYPAAIYDLKTALKWVRSHAKDYKLDRNKLVVAGFSAGGELAAFIGNTNNNKKFEGKECFNNISSEVQAIVDLDGTLSFVHPESGEGDDSKRTSAGTYWFGYSKKENPKLWEEASPLTYAGPHSVPTLFTNSAVDRMHAGRTDYINILNKYHIYTEVKTFDGAPHSFPLFHPWFEPTVTYIDEFLKKVFPSK
jgi:pectinesterase